MPRTGLEISVLLEAVGDTAQNTFLHQSSPGKGKPAGKGRLAVLLAL